MFIAWLYRDPLLLATFEIKNMHMLLGLIVGISLGIIFNMIKEPYSLLNKKDKNHLLFGLATLFVCVVAILIVFNILIK